MLAHEIENGVPVNVCRNSWRLAYSVDFTTLPNQTFSSSGDYSLDGKTWNVKNVASTSSFALVNGQGVVISTPTNALRDATRTGAYLQCSVADLLPSLPENQRLLSLLRLEIRYAVGGTPSASGGNSEYVRTGLFGNTYYAEQKFEMMLGHDGTNAVVNVDTPAASTYYRGETSATTLTSLGFTPRCMALERSATGTLYFTAADGSLPSRSWTRFNSASKSLLALPLWSSASIYRQVFFFGVDKSGGTGITSATLLQLRVFYRLGTTVAWLESP